MIHSNKYRFKLVVYLFMMRVVTNNSHDTETRAENILSKLEASVRQQEEYINSLEAQQYTVLRFTGDNMRFENVYREWQSIFGESHQDEMISIITLRNFYPDEACDEEEYMIKFAKALQEQVRGNEDHTLFDNLIVSVNCIRRSHIEDLDHLYNVTGELDNDLKVLTIMMMENFYEICQDLLKEMIYRFINGQLYSYNLCSQYKSYTKKGCLDEYSKKIYRKVIQKLKDWKADELAYFDKEWRYLGQESYFDTLFEQMNQNFPEHERSELYEKEEIFRKFYIYAITFQHTETFRQGIIDLITKYIDIFNSDDAQASFVKFFAAFCDMIDSELEGDDEHCQLEHFNFIMDASTRARLPNQVKDYMDTFKLHNMKVVHIGTFKTLIDIICQNICAENISTIVMRGKLTSAKINRLCNIVKNKRIFETECKHQIIFIDDEKAITKEDAKIASANCDLIDFYISAGVKAIELFALATTAENDTNEGAKFVNIKYRRYITENKEAGQVICRDKFADFNKMSLTVSRSKSKMPQSKKVFELLKMCLKKNNSNFVEICAVSIKVNQSLYYINIVHHISQDDAKQMFSLFYDLPKTEMHTNQNPLTLARYTKYLDNVPLSFIDNIIFAIQILPLTTNHQFGIPNIKFTNNREFLYTEHIVDKKSFVKCYRYMKHYLEECYGIEIVECEFQKISIEQILDLNIRGESKSDDILAFVEKTQLTGCEFNWILREVVLRKCHRDIEDVGLDIIDRYNTSVQLELYLTTLEDGNIVLHISQTKESSHIHNIAINPIRVLTKILESEKSETLKTLDDAMKNLGKKISFITLVIADVCKRLNCRVNPRKNENLGLNSSDCQVIIEKHIKDLIKEVQTQNDIADNDDTSSKRKKLLEALNSIDQKENDALADMIVEELIPLAKKRETKITSIKIGKVHILNAIKDKAPGVNDISEQHEDVLLAGEENKE